MSFYYLNSISKNQIWGSEEWLLSSHPSGVSKTFLNNEEIPLNEIPELEEKSLPILVKIIDAKDTLSIQLHPNDEYSKKHENDNGKSECWYILDTIKNNTIIVGLNENATEENIKALVQNDKIPEYAKYIPIKKHDFIYIPPGTIHAIQGNTKILEVQQSSNVTYRVSDWGRGRETHIDKALQTIDINDRSLFISKFENFDCEYFSVGCLKIEGIENLNNNYDIIYFYILEGECTVNNNNLSKNSSAVIFNENDIKIAGDALVYYARTNWR